MATTDTLEHNRSQFLLDHLCIGVRLLQQLRGLNDREEIDGIQSITSKYDQLCLTLSQHFPPTSTTYVECKYLDKRITGRLKYLETLEAWYKETGTAITQRLDSASPALTEVLQNIWSRLDALQENFQARGLKIQSVQTQRLHCSSEPHHPPNTTQRHSTSGADDLGKKYRELLVEMETYENGRREDELAIKKLDTEVIYVLSKVQARLRIIHDEVTKSPPIHQQVLDLMISDKIISLVEGTTQDITNLTSFAVKLEMLQLTAELLESTWNKCQPALAIVDVLVPERRPVESDCPACTFKLGNFNTVHFAQRDTVLHLPPA
ncbi:hypothetical protein H0H93_000136 [Arthromyces matolae]|nr:hypothetical protein H0H93_000136 [Arthromyces matolae]